MHVGRLPAAVVCAWPCTLLAGVAAVTAYGTDSAFTNVLPAPTSYAHLTSPAMPTKPHTSCVSGCLPLLQALCIPMWRRSLGGRAHPLAPALSAALRRLTGLTNLAVDGKFSQLGVVSGLTNLRQLASAAPLSKEGWQVRPGAEFWVLRERGVLGGVQPPFWPFRRCTGRPDRGNPCRF